jgi:hypothetical protein
LTRMWKETTVAASSAVDTMPEFVWRGWRKHWNHLMISDHRAELNP